MVPTRCEKQEPTWFSMARARSKTSQCAAPVRIVKADCRHEERSAGFTPVSVRRRVMYGVREDVDASVSEDEARLREPEVMRMISYR